MANADYLFIFNKCIRSLGELRGSKSDVRIEQISRVYSKSIGYLDKERDVLRKIYVACNGKLFPTNLWSSLESANYLHG